MLRIRRYIKPYLLLLVVAIVLLFAQANFDLALPDYLSQIVNTGIQQNGVADAVPNALRQSTLERLTLFLSEDEAATVRKAYTLVEPSAATAAQIGRYPALADEPIYLLDELTADEREQLTMPIATALLSVGSAEQLLADPAAAAALDANTIEQMAIAQVRAEYEALGADIAQTQTSYILRIGAIMLGITLLSGIASIGVGFLASRIAAGVGRDLRHDVFRKVESFSGAEFDKFPTASLITRTTNDITQVQTVMTFLVRLVFYAPIMGVGGIIRAIDKGSSMWWTIAVAVIVLLGVIGLIIAIAVPKFRIMQKLIDRLNLVSRENLSGLMVIRAFNMQVFEENRFDNANKDLADNTLFIARVTAVMMPMMMLILNVLSVLILWVGANQVAAASMQVGDVMAFLQYAMQIVFAFLMLSMLFILWPRASVSADRIADVLETEPTILDPISPVALNGNFHGNIEFHNVSFRYPGANADVLQEINFVAQPGETTAFIGSTGSGKSTIVNLIPRFYDVTEGAITVDGIDIRAVTQHDLRDKIGYVPQKGMLFSGTIESNLRYANELASAETLQKAISIAQASEFVDSKPDRMQTEISQGGTNVSGGQRQRLSIARALVKEAPVYIFDDTFSALDFKTDAALRRALQQTTQESTLLVVTQRVSTVKNAEQIIVLDKGRVVGKGTHEELMDSCETYQEIALSQLSIEELA